MGEAIISRGKMHIPQRGIDYWTDDDKDDILTEVDGYLNDKLADRMQITPEFANTIEECVDTSKLYVLPDGYIYAYYEPDMEPSYTNMIRKSLSTDLLTSFNSGKGYIDNYRFSSSSGAFVESEGRACTGFIKIKENDVIRLKNLAFPYGSYSNNNIVATIDMDSTWGYYTEEAFLQAFDVEVDDSNNVTKLTFLSGGTYYFCINTESGNITDSSIITINEEITENDTLIGWQSTGHAFVPTDYEDRILELEKCLKGDLDIYGIVDGDKNIVMTGSLISGTYSAKYQNEDGTTVDIGTFVIE